jgi:tripartite-type tricarboxylate transporter receptor subunit TctC
MTAHNIRRLFGAALLALAAVSLASPAVRADPIADFYHGRTVNLIIGTSTGNDYDFRARLLARHLGRHIPGEPTIVPQNMPGVGGVKAANWLAAIAPRDGTALHMIMSNMMSSQAIGAPGAQSLPASSSGSAIRPAPPMSPSPGTRAASPRSSR